MTLSPEQIADLVLLSAGACFAWIWALGLLVSGGRRAWVPAMLVAFSGLWLFSAAYFASGLYRVWPHAVALHLPAVYCLGPLLYVHYRRQLNIGGRADRWLPLHFAPAFVVAIVLVPLFLLPPHMRLQVLDGSGPYSRIVVLLSLGPKLSVLTYVVACGFVNRAALLGAVRNSQMRTPLLMALWAVLLPTALGILAGVLAHVLRLPGLMRVSVYSLPLLLILFFLLSMRHPDLFPRVAREVRRGVYARSRIENIDVPRLVDQMERMMIEEQLYADEDFSLHQLSAALDITHHQLSQLLNEQLQTPFKAYVNGFRIAAARKLLLAEPERSVLSVAFAVGFNSKSAFHRAFNESVGATPTQFRRKYGALQVDREQIPAVARK